MCGRADPRKTERPPAQGRRFQSAEFQFESFTNDERKYELSELGN